MSGTVYVKAYEAPEVNVREILRYAGVRGDVAAFEALVRDCLAELDGKLVYKVCYREFPVALRGETLDLGFMMTDSAALKKNLAGCDSIVLFAATVGVALDRAIAKYSRLTPSRALFLQAIGAERIESLCDGFAQDIAAEKAKEGLSTCPRFSPGYGDFPLEAQKNIFAVLDCPRKIGLTLNDSLLMSPSKSVTAIIGQYEAP